ncbi:hypothetical protein FQA39_LY02879 [Lamprigera yunnana]|nr:hypothetical protein FQA39_LY02879 [Lamprigera yunnana]
MMLGLLTILCAWILIKIYRYGTYNFSYWEKKKIPYIKPTFFFGILYDTIINQELIGVYLAKFYNTFTGPFFGCFALQIPILVLTDLDAIKSFLLKDARYFSNRYIYNNPDVDPIIAYGLFGARGPLWKILKPSLTKLFTLSKIKSIFKLSKESRRHFNDYLESKVNQNIEAKAMSQKFVSNLLARSVFGVHVNTFADENSPFNMPRKKFFGTSFVRTFTLLCYYYCPTLVRLFRLKFCNHRIQKYFVSVFNESITKREALKIKQGDMIDLLVEFKNKKQAKLGLSWDVVTAQACLFYVSGQESIASTIAFTLHELCLNTDVQSRLRKEIRDTKKKHGEITYNSLQEMKYLDMVVSENIQQSHKSIENALKTTKYQTQTLPSKMAPSLLFQRLGSKGIQNTSLILKNTILKDLTVLIETK